MTHLEPFPTLSSLSSRVRTPAGLGAAGLVLVGTALLLVGFQCDQEGEFEPSGEGSGEEAESKPAADDREGADDEPETEDTQGAATPSGTTEPLRLGLAEAGLEAGYRPQPSVADVDGDGHPDVLLPRSNDPTGLYLGNGDGTFERAGADLPECHRCGSSIDDLDGDGNPDLLFGGHVYLGHGDGTFERADAGLRQTNWSSSAVADVDGDGHLDVLLVGNRSGPVADLYLGEGDGTFERSDADLTGVWRGSTSAADLNEDGHPDLLITGEDPDEEPNTTLYLGNGDGTFEAADTGLENARYSDTSIADVDGDGHLDVLLTGWAFDPPGLYLGNGDGTFEKAEADLVDAKYSGNAVADVDGDGHMDLLITGEAVGSEGPYPTTQLYLGDGDANFEESDERLKGVKEGFPAIADFDGDGTSDLLVAGEDKRGERVAHLYLGGGEAGFPPSGEPFYVDRKLAREDLRGLGLRTLSLLRNTIFARAGHEFETDWLDEHFRNRSWYEPTGLDEERISDRDRQNAELIAAFEEDLTLDQLLARRALHWGPHGKPPEEWEPPGPFEEEAKAREALLIDEAIEERRRKGAESSTPEIPRGFGDGFALGASVDELPDGIERNEVGQYVSGRLDSETGGDAQLRRGKNVSAFTDAEGRIEQVFATLPRGEAAVPLAEVPNSTNNARALSVVEAFGEPAEYGHLSWSHASTNFEPMRWESKDRVAELRREVRHGGSHEKFLLIHDGNPERICGPEDGFDEWFEEFEAALASGDAERAADFFHFPFEDWGGPASARHNREHEMNRGFETREEFLEQVPDNHAIAPPENKDAFNYGSLALDPPPSSACVPTEGHVARTVGGGHYVFRRVDGEWKAVSLAL